MDFDFNTEEKQLLDGLEKALAEFSDTDEGRDLESGDVDRVQQNTTAGLGLLAGAGYLKLAQEGNLAGASTLMAAMELVASASPSLFLTVETSTRLCGRALAAFGSSAQKERWLQPILEGKSLGALALTEATTNVVNDGLETRGEPADGGFAVTGSKGFVVNAPLADLTVVVGMADDKLALFIIERGAAGMTVGERLALSGYGGAAVAPLELEGCVVPEEQVIRPDSPEGVMASLRFWQDQILTGAGLGLMKTSFGAAKKHAKSHKTGGKPIIAYQEVSFKLAEMLTLYQTSQWLAYRATWANSIDDPDGEVLSNCAKVFCGESAEKVASEALQILAAHGLVSSSPVDVAYRCSKLCQVGGTSTEIARVAIGDDALRRWG